MGVVGVDGVAGDSDIGSDGHSPVETEQCGKAYQGGKEHEAHHAVGVVGPDHDDGLYRANDAGRHVARWRVDGRAGIAQCGASGTRGQDVAARAGGGCIVSASGTVAGGDTAIAGAGWDIPGRSSTGPVLSAASGTVRDELGVIGAFGPLFFVLILGSAIIFLC